MKNLTRDGKTLKMSLFVLRASKSYVMDVVLDSFIIIFFNLRRR